MKFGWTADENLSHAIFSAAFQAGINFIDTANIYSRWVEGNPGGIAETIIGNWIEKASIPRHSVIIATKVRGRMGDGPNDEGLSRAHIFNSIDDTLRRLKCEYVDIYQTHWYDEKTSIEETLSALHDLVRQGKVRYIGCSNYPAWRLTEAIWTSKHHRLTRFDTLQPHYNLVHRAEFERELADVCQAYDIGVIPYSPLAGGFLTGKYRKNHQPDSVRARGLSRYFKDENWTLLDNMERLGKQKGSYTISQIALAWLLSNPIITSPIIGPRSINQLEDNLGAVGLRLSIDEKNTLDEASSWKDL